MYVLYGTLHEHIYTGHTDTRASHMRIKASSCTFLCLAIV